MGPTTCCAQGHTRQRWRTWPQEKKRTGRQGNIGAGHTFHGKWEGDIYIYIYISSMWWKGLNSVKTGSKRAKNTCLSIPNGPGSLLEKRVFHPFLTHFWSQNGPFSRYFGIFHEPKPVGTGSKWAKTTCLSIINGPGSLLEKCVFHPFLTHCWSQNGPFSRYFEIFHGPNLSARAQNGLKPLV